MKLIIRKPNLEILTAKGIPKDFEDVKNYFNKALESNLLPWIPRKTPITIKEIKELWLPSLEQNINLLAEVDEKIIGSLNVFYNTNSTAYEHKTQRKLGNIGFTADPNYYTKVTSPLIQKLIVELKKQNKKAVWTLAKESPGNKILNDLGYNGKLIKNQERYKQEKLSGDVFKYNLP